MIELDGNYGEGGGSLVRVALALSTLTGQAFRVSNIRAGREQGGLKAQHLEAIKALQQICDAKTSEIEIGSTEFWFKPEKIKKGIYEIDIGTAGSITLLLQALILPALFASGKVTLVIKGGTCGKWQASVDYLQQVLLPQLQRFVEKIELKVIKRGYYPKGGGEIKLEITPRFKLYDFNTFAEFNEDLQFKTSKIKFIEQGKLEQIRGLVNASNELQEKEVGERIKNSAESSLRKYEVPINVRVEYSSTLSTGGDFLLWAIFSQEGKVDSENPIIIGSDALVEIGKSSEQIGKEAAEKLMKEMDAGFPVDSHLADQLIMFMGLLPRSEIHSREITNHTLSNMYVTEKFLPVGFKVEKNKIRVEVNDKPLQFEKDL
ncbi:RNA 3'-terminal phosphate cyclase [Candidatus Woesearchaeota archaeon]|nr:RNA 3'-terminal phosphate cyclase [Candidatus Woesearchaeota archaeon]